MTKPENFIISSDYASIKNDGYDSTLTVVVPASVVVTAGSVYTVTALVTVGSSVSNIRARLYSSKNGNWYSTASLMIPRTGVVSGSPAGYEVLSVVTRENATQVRLTAFIRNPYGATLTGAAGTETIQAEVNTFLSPFV